MAALLAILVGTFTVIGNTFAKAWAEKGSVTSYALMLAFFLASSLTYPLAIKQGKLSVTTAAINVCVLLATALIGIFLFKERPGTMRVVGILLACASIVLLMYPQPA